MEKQTKLPPPRDGMSPFQYAISLVSGKWKLPLLFEIGTNGQLRYGELRRTLPGISDKVLAEQLKQLEDTGLVIRTEYDDGAVLRVEYSLTVVGMDFMLVIMEMCRWGKRCGWENMTPERGWKEVVTIWGPLEETDNIHWPNEVCRRIHTLPLSEEPAVTKK